MNKMRKQCKNNICLKIFCKIRIMMNIKTLQVKKNKFKISERINKNKMIN